MPTMSSLASWIGIEMGKQSFQPTLTWQLLMIGRVFGIFWKCARVGERLSPYVSLCCIIMAVSVIYVLMGWKTYDGCVGFPDGKILSWGWQIRCSA